MHPDILVIDIDQNTGGRIMKTRIVTLIAVTGLMFALSVVELFAEGHNNGGGNRHRNGSCVTTQTETRSSAAYRPAGSQRRDGTFLSTGVTANGSTVRPGKGNGLQDGSRLNTSATTAPVPAQ